MADAARLFQLGEAVTGLRLAFNDPLRAPALVRPWRWLSAVRASTYRLDPGSRHFFPLHRDHQVDDVRHPVMLVAVAAFNIVATLVMIVKEKQTTSPSCATQGAGPPMCC